MARPTKLTAQLEEQIVRAIRAGSFPEVAARYAGVDRSTYYRWMERGDPEGTRSADRPHRRFRRAVEQAQAADEVRDTTLVGKAAERDWRAAAWRFERRHRARWGRQAGEEGEVPEPPVLALPDGSQVNLRTLSDAELDALEGILARFESAGDGPATVAYAERIWHERFRRQVPLTDPEYQRIAKDSIVPSRSSRSAKGSAGDIHARYDALGRRYGLPPKPRRRP
jgi:hypothetical protein